MVDLIFKYKFQGWGNAFIEIYANNVRVDSGTFSPEMTIPLYDITDIQNHKPGAFRAGSLSFKRRSTGEKVSLWYIPADNSYIESILTLLMEKVALAEKQYQNNNGVPMSTASLSSAKVTSDMGMSVTYGQPILLADDFGFDKIELFVDAVRISKNYKRNPTITDFYLEDIKSITKRQYGGVSSLTINTDDTPWDDDGKADTPNRIFFNDRNQVQFETIRNAIESKLYEIRSKPKDPTTVIVREIVKVPCPYCNTLVEVTETKCPSCGAPQTR